MWIVCDAFGFCFGLQASLECITQERIDLYRKKLLLYMLDGLPQRSIMLTKPIWYEDFIVESFMFQTECRRINASGVPPTLVDVVGDGNCLLLSATVSSLPAAQIYG